MRIIWSSYKQKQQYEYTMKFLHIALVVLTCVSISEQQKRLRCCKLASIKQNTNSTSILWRSSAKIVLGTAWKHNRKPAVWSVCFLHMHFVVSTALSAEARVCPFPLHTWGGFLQTGLVADPERHVQVCTDLPVSFVQSKGLGAQCWDCRAYLPGNATGFSESYSKF